MYARVLEEQRPEAKRGEFREQRRRHDANAWPAAFMPGTKVGDVFNVPGCVGSGVRNATFLEALGFTGGRSVRAGAEALLRAAVGGLLNSASACVQYPVCSDALIAQVDAVLATCDRAAMQDAIASFAALETLGCPLDQRGVCSN